MGSVYEVYIAGLAGALMTRVPGVMAVADRGLEGDRYCLGKGSFSRWPDSGRAVTFIARETIEAVLAEFGIDLSAGRSRRNIVTEGVGLDALNGKKFCIGQALLRGSRVAAPCRYLERLTEPGVFEALRGRGGLRADILEAGVISEGDLIVPV